MGVRYDASRDRLFATTSGIPQRAGFQPADTAIAALLRIHPETGAIEKRWDLPPTPGGHVLGDLAIGANGDVFVTDSAEPVFYVLRAGADTLHAIRHPLFRSLQGVAPAPGGAVVYVADWSHGLLRVDLTTEKVTRLPDAKGSTSLGCDGIVWRNGAIIAVQNGVSIPRVMRYTLSKDGTGIAAAEVLDRNVAVADEPTIGTIAGDEFVYVANSQWEKYTDDGARRYDHSLADVMLLGVPLGR